MPCRDTITWSVLYESAYDDPTRYIHVTLYYTILCMLYYEIYKYMPFTPFLSLHQRTIYTYEESATYIVGSRARVQGFWFRVRVQVQGLGFMVQGLESPCSAMKARRTITIQHNLPHSRPDPIVILYKYHTYNYTAQNISQYGINDARPAPYNSPKLHLIQSSMCYIPRRLMCTHETTFITTSNFNIHTFDTYIHYVYNARPRRR